MRIAPALLAVIFLALAAAAHAGGNLTVTGSNLSTTYTNSNATIRLLNLTLNVTPSSGDGSVNVTLLNVTVAGTVAANTTGNISSVALLNETGHSIGSNTSINTTTNKTLITISGGFTVTTASNRSLLVAVTLSPTARRFATVAANINASADVGMAAAGNVTLSGTLSSSAAQIQDLHAFASASPSFVDTNVTNQTFIYSLTVTGSDIVDNFTLTLPTNYSIVNVTNITQGSNVLLNSTLTDSTVTRTFTQNTVFVSRTGGFSASGGVVRTVFTANTNTSSVDIANFSASASGSNLTGVSADATSSGTMVTTQQLLSIVSIGISKNSAIINDTDFWEFNFTINFTANVSGYLQFRMDKWNNSAGQIINLTNQTALTNSTRYYATLRNESSFSTGNKINLTENYNFTDGISFTSSGVPATAGTVRTLILRMVVPSGTPAASHWFTAFNMLFRPFA